MTDGEKESATKEGQQDEKEVVLVAGGIMLAGIAALQSLLAFAVELPAPALHAWITACTAALLAGGGMLWRGLRLLRGPTSPSGAPSEQAHGTE